MAAPLVKLRLRSLLDRNNVAIPNQVIDDRLSGESLIGVTEPAAEITIDGSERLREWLIVRVGDNHIQSAHMRRFREVLRECFGPKVLVLTGDVEFCVFEPVEDEPPRKV